MSIFVHEEKKTFHIQNKEVSYIMTVLPGGYLGQLYFGRKIHDREEYPWLVEGCIRSHAALIEDNADCLSLEHLRQEYPVYGSTDFRQGAVEILQENGSRLTDFVYAGCAVESGKGALTGLPATYVNEEGEAETLKIFLEDKVAGLRLTLSYSIFRDYAVIARSAKIENRGNASVKIEKIMSMNLDLPDADYDWIQFSGSWGRERFPMQHRLAQGIQSVGSLRGHSSHQHNPFVMLKRPDATEHTGEVIGLSLLYSGNFVMQAEVDTYDVTRLQAGINPTWFSWKLDPGASFETPETVIAWSEAGMNGLSQTLHELYHSNLTRGAWKTKARPILINNWEATTFDFNEEKILHIAEKAKTCGVEMFVLDDGWFGGRRSDQAGLGDWYPATELLPEGITGLAKKIEAMGMKFGLWIEPEMVNPDSDLYREHPDWILSVPDRRISLGRHQCVLDFSRPEVVDHIHREISKVLREAPVSYVKWDMNRSITECYSHVLPADRQGEVFHRYILGVYDLYERFIAEFPDMLFESCAGGGGRFDAGLLYYAPQAWTSDDTDAAERMKIQYGTSYGYPVSSMGSHVSAVPNDQVGRVTPLKTRAAVAYFGTFGYELDLNLLTEDEIEDVKRYTQFMKDHRDLIQFGTFYRLASPFEGNIMAWMVVNADRTEALVGRYRVLIHANEPFSRLRLKGLDPDACYEVEGPDVYGHGHSSVPGNNVHYGDELMETGIVISEHASGKVGKDAVWSEDFSSELFILRKR
ncbi:MAG: alpha-galactosidase [Lachnospiraceae bacterium]|nr:alpha-galactosidase [Lachnospiraceae bacterium]